MREFDVPGIVHQLIKVAVEGEADERCSMAAVVMMVVGAPCGIVSPCACQPWLDQSMGCANACVEHADGRSVCSRTCDAPGEIVDPVMLGDFMVFAAFEKRRDGTG